MGKFLDKIKGVQGKAKEGVDEFEERMDKKDDRRDLDPRKFRQRNDEERNKMYDDYDDFEEDYGFDDEVGIQVAQKPASFHHFILENQYKDLEKSIRGYKDVYDKDTQQWKVKRKKAHCFTDEEAEEILRTAQSHLATDIKLGWIKKDSFGDYMDAVYKEVAFLFESIAEYRYGRYNKFTKKDKNGKKKFISVAYQAQYNMKLQNQKIFLELWTRIQANYSRSIEGNENKATHGSVKGQESLQGGGDGEFRRDRYRGYS